MKILFYIGMGIVGIILIGAAFIWKYNYDVPPSEMMFYTVKVSNTEVELSGEFLTGLTWFGCYGLNYQNETLYVRIKGGFHPWEKGGIHLFINNKFGNIKAIYLKGKDPSNNILIWPQNNTQKWLQQ